MSAYDPRLKCMQQVEADEVAALALAVGKSRERPEDVIPEQLIPVDDITLVHIQPGVCYCFVYSSITLFTANCRS